MSDIDQLMAGVNINAVPARWQMMMFQDGRTGRMIMTFTIAGDKWTVEPTDEHGVRLVPPVTVNNDKLVEVISTVLLTKDN